MYFSGVAQHFKCSKNVRNSVVQGKFEKKTTLVEKKAVKKLRAAKISADNRKKGKY